ncbi:MAG: hypothetical protein ACM3ML_14595 [Micromonosporaceae bacterium]
MTPDVIAPPDYEFGPPPGAEAPGPEAPGSEAPQAGAQGTYAPGAEAPGLQVSVLGPPSGQAGDAWMQGTDTPGTWISDAPAYPAGWSGQQGSDVPGFPMTQPAGGQPQLPAPPGAPDNGQQAAPPLMPAQVHPPGAAPVTAPGAGPGAQAGTLVPWQPPPAQFQPSPGPGTTGGFPGQPPFPQGSQPPAGPRRPGRGRLLAIGAVVIALAVVASAVALLKVHSAPHKTAQGGPGPAHSSAPPLRLASKIDNVTTDPKPITKSEIFPDVHVSASGRQFARVAIALNRNCARTARGSFARALKADRCERVVRATYVDTAKRFAITVGVAALPTKTLAKRANRAKRLMHNIWFAGLDGGKGSGAEMVSRSGGYAYGVVEGRYIIFGYATYSDGHMPTGKGRQDQVLNSLSRVFAQLAEQPINVRALG